MAPSSDHNQRKPFHYFPQKQPTCPARTLAWYTLPSHSWLGGRQGPSSKLPIERPASARVEDGGFRFVYRTLANGSLVEFAKHKPASFHPVRDA
ncbi:hypothetical protein F9C07_3864 [Aspergillus flavus]|uniref:Uncharacterized protein n=1 Tax=Aspergillus flavus (strain ATCC 200026 / FGSC A1120 / IAM 13836 / NRRL 3357 / JCM 12722 / SRRC 167) TaxID=332952 RepID=A0A7U2QZ09_ASPFN|nr:hypothetical protein F9C07_3864 [Aspergillus flavus]